MSYRQFCSRYSAELVSIHGVSRDSQCLMYVDANRLIGCRPDGLVTISRYCHAITHIPTGMAIATSLPWAKAYRLFRALESQSDALRGIRLTKSGKPQKNAAYFAVRRIVDSISPREAHVG